jgi:hypothetical protein
MNNDAFFELAQRLGQYLNDKSEDANEISLAVPKDTVIQVVDFDKSTAEECHAITITSKGIKYEAIPATKLSGDKSEW